MNIGLDGSIFRLASVRMFESWRADAEILSANCFAQPFIMLGAESFIRHVFLKHRHSP